MDLNAAARAIYDPALPLGHGLLFRKEERGPISWYFLLTLLIILAYGLVMLFSASYATGYYRFDGDSWHFIRQQVIFALVGLGLLFLSANINYRWLRRWTWAFYIVSCILLAGALLVPTREGFDFKRWIFIGGYSFQPSEIAKFAVILCTATMISRFNKQRKTLKYGILYPAIPVIGILFLIYFEPHFSAIILITAIFFTMLLTAGCALRWMVGVCAVGGAGVYLLLTSQNGYVQERLSGWSLLAGEEGNMLYQTRQSLYSIASGGLLGQGIGNSRQKHLWLPEATNDFIFSVLCEELGFVGAFLCMALFAALIIQGIRIALRAPDLFGTMLTIGIISQVAWQMACNLGVVTDLLPNTGISLPFFSSGGTSLMMLLAEMGLVLSVSRAGNAKAQAQQQAQQQAFDKRLGRVYRRGDGV